MTAKVRNKLYKSPKIPQHFHPTLEFNPNPHPETLNPTLNYSCVHEGKLLRKVKNWVGGGDLEREGFFSIFGGVNLLTLNGLKTY